MELPSRWSYEEGFSKNKHGEIVSRRTQAAKRRRLEKHGYFAKKGKFGYVKKDAKSLKSKKNKTAKKTAKKGRGKSRGKR